MEKFKVYVLGCRGSRPVFGAQYEAFGGATSCYIVKADTQAVVLDCGTGLYDAAPYLKGCTQIDVLVTHLHYDHILGLLNSSVFPPDATVRFYAAGLTCNPSEFLKPPYWPISPHVGEAISVECGNTVQLSERVSACFFPANHPDGAAIIRVNVDDKAFALISDWEHADGSLPTGMTEGCSFFFYDGMFDDAEYPTYSGWGHSTWQEGVKLAKERHIPRLMITHHLPERTDEQLHQMEAEAAQVFPKIRFAHAGDVYNMEGELVS